MIRPQDKQNFTLLLAEFHRQLDAYGATVGKHYSLSAFLPADPAKIAAGWWSYDDPDGHRAEDRVREVEGARRGHGLGARW